ncbi:MAG: DsbA family oxidoreductase [Acidimicrobiales bacterium]
MTVIDVYADIWCPFAHVGLRSVVRRRNELGRDDVVVRVRAWPLELVNGKPLDSTTTSEHAGVLRAQVASDLFSHFDPERFPTTSLPALALAAAAYRQSDRIGESVSLALRGALFEDGRDISRADVLTGVGSAHGLGQPDAEDDERVRADWHEGEARGVKGSPHFFCGSVEAFCPSLDISKDEDGEKHIRRNMDALDAFLAECFKF